LKLDKGNALTLNNNMDNKTNAIVLIVIAMIFLFVVIAFKIKSDKKRRSLVISTAEREKNIGLVKNESQGKKPYLWGIPSWGLALLTMFLAFVILMVVGDIITAIFKIPESDIGGLVFYILYNLIIAGGCFYICRQNPKSIWYVPVLCNIIGIISAIIEPNFWISSLWIVICIGWVLSIIVSIIGARLGSKKEILSIQ
jgi:hypothetical protein